MYVWLQTPLIANRMRSSLDNPDSESIEDHGNVICHEQVSFLKYYLKKYETCLAR